MEDFRSCVDAQEVRAVESMLLAVACWMLAL
jgi:hypothetical protein